MLTTPHAVVGATIGTIFPNPVIYIPLSIASHFILDSIPHWQETLYPYKPYFGTWIRIPIDIIFSLVLVGIISSSHQEISQSIWISAIAANVSDLDGFGIIYKNLFKNITFKKYYNWHCRIQRETSSLLGLIPQLIIILLSLKILL